MVTESMTNEIKWMMPWIAMTGIAGFAIGYIVGSR